MAENFEARVASAIGDESSWLTPHEVSRITGFTIGTLNTWRARRKGPPHHSVGRSVRYEAQLVREWMVTQAQLGRGRSRA